MHLAECRNNCGLSWAISVENLAVWLRPTVHTLSKSAGAAGAVKLSSASGIPAVIDSAIVISADRSVKYETVVKVMDVLQRAGVQRVGLSVQLVN